MRRVLLVVSILLALSVGALVLRAATTVLPEDPCRERVSALESELASAEARARELDGLLRRERAENEQLRSALGQLQGQVPEGGTPFWFEGKKYFLLPAEPRGTSPP